jgi:hypothetical protein
VPSWCKTPEDWKTWIWIKNAQIYDEYASWMPDTQVVVVGDRECDFSGHHYAVSELRHIGSLVRACHDRRLAGEYFSLFEPMPRQEVAGTVTVDVSRQSEVVRHSGSRPRKARAARRAVLEVRYAKSGSILRRKGRASLLWRCSASPSPRGSKAGAPETWRRSTGSC